MASFIEEADLIKEAVQKEQGTDPIVIAKHLMHLPGISMRRGSIRGRITRR